MPELKGRRKIFHKLVTMEEAERALRSLVVKEAASEEVPLEHSSGRVVSQSIFSQVDLPPFDRAEMDGYAVSSADIEGASDMEPIVLMKIGSIGAGEMARGGIGVGQCMEIATGAPLPRGADSVVMVEYTKAEGERITIFRGTTPGENVASAGSDVQIGEMLVREGTSIGSREAGLLAAAGVRAVKVFRKPKVGILSTGDELVVPGSSLEGGKIFDSNTYALAVAVDEAGGEVEIIGKAGDSFEEIRELVLEGLSKNDLLLISGGTSAGTGDLVYRVLDECCDGGIVVHGLNVKPGKPTLIASHRGKAVVGLPGYPVSALMIFDQLVRPFIEEMAKARVGGGGRHAITASLAVRVNGAKGRRWFLPVHIMVVRGEARAYPVIASSGAVGTLAKADGYIIVGEDVEYLASGEKVNVYPFPGIMGSVDVVVMGSHCPGLDLLLQLLYETEGITAKALNVGSLAGLRAVKGGECDIAGVHILDEREMTYNIRAVEEAGLPPSCLIKGYRREQGIMVAPGNPRGIRGMEDCLRQGITFVNRNRGSGTRVLTDRILRDIAVGRGMSFEEVVAKIKGYRWEAKTHSAVAAAVAQGRADMGVGIKSLASFYGLEFIPLREEHYDFVVNPASREKPAVLAFIKGLRTEGFKKMLRNLPGYNI